MIATTTPAPAPYLNPAPTLKPTSTQPDALPPPPLPTRPKPKPPTKTPAPNPPEPNAPAPQQPAPPTPEQPTAPTTTNPVPKAKEPNRAHELGRRGEELAAQYVKARGLTVLCRNWRCREGEIDILATDGEMVVVCEVKTRTNDNYGTPADAMNPKKIRRIKEATNRWLREYRVPYVPLRYDLAEIWWPPDGEPQLQYRRDAF